MPLAHLGTHFSEKRMKIKKFQLKKMHSKMSFAKWPHFVSVLIYSTFPCVQNFPNRGHSRNCTMVGSWWFARQIIVWYCEVIPSHSFKINTRCVSLCQIHCHYIPKAWCYAKRIYDTKFVIKNTKINKLYTYCCTVTPLGPIIHISPCLPLSETRKTLPAAFHLHECKINILLACGLLGPFFN